MIKDSVKYLQRFKNDSFFDDASLSFLSIGGEETDVSIALNGYQMKHDQFLFSDNINMSISDSWIIGFKLIPDNKGVALHPNTSAKESIEMPLIELLKQDSPSYDSAISIREFTQENNTNYFKLSLNNGVYEAISQPYSASRMHYIWIVGKNDGVESYCEVYIDGEENSIEENGTIPSFNDFDVLKIYINSFLDENYDYNKTSNTGIIDDLIIFNLSDYQKTDIQNYINYGVGYIADSSYGDTYTTSIVTLSDLPSTIRVNSSINDAGYVYIARNDGKILRGSPLLWEVRSDFADEKNISLLENEYGQLQTNKGYLKITNKMLGL